MVRTVTVASSLVGISYAALLGAVSEPRKALTPQQQSALGDGEGFTWGLAGFISCVPLFGWTVGVFLKNMGHPQDGPPGAWGVRGIRGEASAGANMDSRAPYCPSVVICSMWECASEQCDGATWRDAACPPCASAHACLHMPVRRACAAPRHVTLRPAPPPPPRVLLQPDLSPPLPRLSQSWALVAISSEERSTLYLTYAGLYAAPLLARGLDWQDPWALSVLALGAVHMQVRPLPSTQPAPPTHIGPGHGGSPAKNGGVCMRDIACHPVPSSPAHTHTCNCV